MDNKILYTLKNTWSTFLKYNHEFLKISRLHSQCKKEIALKSVYGTIILFIKSKRKGDQLDNLFVFSCNPLTIKSYENRCGMHFLGNYIPSAKTPAILYVFQ
jgi:hypothetical protein